jgi:hypothetical protein
MHFFRSEEHLHRWEGFQEKKEGGIIGLDSLMQLFSVPYFRNRSGPDWVSKMGEYLAGLLGELDKVDGAGSYWRMSPARKFGFSLALKLGIM